MSSLYLSSIQAEVSVPVSVFVSRLHSLNPTELQEKGIRIRKLLSVASFSKDANVASLVPALEERQDRVLDAVESRKAMFAKPRMHRLAA